MSPTLYFSLVIIIVTIAFFASELVLEVAKRINSWRKRNSTLKDYPLYLGNCSFSDTCVPGVAPAREGDPFYDGFIDFDLVDEIEDFTLAAEDFAHSRLSYVAYRELNYYIGKRRRFADKLYNRATKLQKNIELLTYRYA